MPLGINGFYKISLPFAPPVNVFLTAAAEQKKGRPPAFPNFPVTVQVLADLIKNYAAISGKSGDVDYISADRAARLAEDWGEAWNVENYLPKNSVYNILEFAQAIMNKNEGTEDESKIAGCNPLCNIVGLFSCRDGILSAKEIGSKSYNGAYLFDLGAGKTAEKPNSPQPAVQSSPSPFCEDGHRSACP